MTDMNDARDFTDLLPPWTTALRPHQQTALEEIVECFEDGAQLVFLDAPTGSGKTLLGEVSGRALEVQRLYTATTKALQVQVMNDFGPGARDPNGPARLLKGRANYPTMQGDGWGMPNCGDCEGENCSFCIPTSLCPYKGAKAAAWEAKCAVLNTAYLLSAVNYTPERWGEDRLVVVDECDALESQLLNMLEVTISARRMKDLHLTGSSFKTLKKTVEETWAPWVERHAIPAVTAWLDARRGDVKKGLDRRRAYYSMRELKGKLEGLVPELKNGGWVYCYSRDSDVVTFKPIKVADYGKEWIWDHADRWLLMSATIVSADEMVESLGVPDWFDWRVVRVPMTFPKENRPVYVWPRAMMTEKGKAEGEWEKLGEAVAQILDHHPDERVLVHTVSFALAAYLWEGLKADYDDRLVTYTEGRGAGEALESYMARANGVLLAPSMARGVDLPDDACRVIVVCKVPYASLGDKQVSARLYSEGGQTWYSVNALREMVQMTGRAVRHEGDRAVTYVLDKQVVAKWNQYKRWLPGWWTEAVIWEPPGMGGSG